MHCVSCAHFHFPLEMATNSHISRERECAHVRGRTLIRAARVGTGSTPPVRVPMSSRGGGPRSAGTDGSDHAFRQTVDTKYKKAAVARRNLTKTLRMLFAYYPLAGAFAVGPALATGVELDAHTAPFAALAVVGLACAALASRDAAAKTFEPKRLRRITKLLACVGFANLVGGVAARALAHEDKRMAWVFATFVTRSSFFKNLRPGNVYPFAVSLELLLEIVGAVIPLGAIALAHALALYAETKTN